MRLTKTVGKSISKNRFYQINDLLNMRPITTMFEDYYMTATGTFHTGRVATTYFLAITVNWNRGIRLF